MIGFLKGVATGLIIGYLTAPRSGKETREQLADSANKKTDELKDKWNETTAKASEQINQLIDDIKSNTGLFVAEANVYADKAEDKLDQYKDDAYYNKQKAKSVYNDKVDDVADAARSGVDKAENALKS